MNKMNTHLHDALSPAMHNLSHQCIS